MKYAWLLALSLVLASNPPWAPTLHAQESKAAEKDEKSEEKGEEAKDEAKKDEESKKDEAKKDEAKKDEAKKDEAKKDEAKKDEEKKPEKKSHTVAAEELEISFEATGTFVARQMEEVRLKPEAWAAWKIKSVVPHGKQVAKGEVLIEFEDEDLKEALEELEIDNRLGELNMMKAEAELPRVEKAMKMAFEQAERSIEEARREYEQYTDVDRERMVKQLELRMKSSEQQVENVREELEQLEKMYKSDDLTEETEEIVLKRQRNQLEQAEFFLESSRISYERSKEFGIPQADIAAKESLEMMEMSFDRAKTAMETDLARVRYEFEKARRARTKAIEKQADLVKDKRLLVIKAPADGIVYYGECVDGAWPNTAGLISKLKPEQSATPNSVLMTIVQPKEFTLTSSVGEANRPGVKKGQEAIITPTADESVKLKGSVAEVSAIPVGPAKFSLELEVAEQEFPEWLVAGMTGKAKVVTYKAEKALTVPKSAVHTDEKNDEKKYVWLVKDGEPARKTVSVGKTKGDKVEITKGLKEGDVVSLEKEADKKEDAEKSDKKEAKQEKDADKKDDAKKSDKKEAAKKEAKEKKESKEEKKADKGAEEEKDKDVEDDKDGDDEKDEEGEDDEQEESESDDDDADDEDDDA